MNSATAIVLKTNEQKEEHMTESDQGGTQSNAEPQWQPLSMMPALTAAINSELQIN